MKAVGCLFCRTTMMRSARSRCGRCRSWTPRGAGRAKWPLPSQWGTAPPVPAAPGACHLAHRPPLPPLSPRLHHLASCSPHSTPRSEASRPGQLLRPPQSPVQVTSSSAMGSIYFTWLWQTVQCLKLFNSYMTLESLKGLAWSSYNDSAFTWLNQVTLFSLETEIGVSINSRIV